MFVKVTRVTERVLRDVVIVEVTLPAETEAGAKNAALDLVQARMACGHAVDWKLESSTQKTFPGPSYETDITSRPEAEIINFEDRKS